MKILILAGLLFTSLGAMASTVRFNDLDSMALDSILNGQSEQIVEFRRGDIIPLDIKIKGDLLSISKSEANVLKVEKDFFIKSNNSAIKISFNGQDYVPLKEALAGSITIGASGNSIPGMLSILLHVEER